MAISSISVRLRSGGLCATLQMNFSERRMGEVLGKMGRLADRPSLPASKMGRILLGPEPKIGGARGDKPEDLAQEVHTRHKPLGRGGPKRRLDRKRPRHQPFVGSV